VDVGDLTAPLDADLLSRTRLTGMGNSRPGGEDSTPTPALTPDPSHGDPI